MSGLGGLDAITIDRADPLRRARFWAAVFGTDVGESDDEGPHYVDLLPAPGVPTLRFQLVPEPKVTKNRLHLDVSVEDLDEASARAEALGCRRISEQALTEYGHAWLVMADTEGSEFCLVTRHGA